MIAMAGFGRCILKTFGSFLNELKDLVIGMGLRTLQQDVKKLIGLRLCIDFRIMLSNLCADVDVVKSRSGAEPPPFMVEFRVTTGPSRTRDPSESATASIRNTMS